MDLSKNSCGACSVCCKALTFELAGSLKPAGVMCPHCTAPKGCGIYETRPQLCRAWYCGWRYLGLGEDWRPDRSEILILLREGPAPDGLQNGVEFFLVGDREKVFWLPLVKYIAALIEEPAPVYLSLPGDPGCASPWVYLSDIAALKDAIARRDLAATHAALRGALQVCIDYPKTKLP